MKAFLLSAALLLTAANGMAGITLGLGKAVAGRSLKLTDAARKKVSGANDVPGAPYKPQASSRLKWAFLAPGAGNGNSPEQAAEGVDYASPAIAADGTIYFGTSGQFVYYSSYWTKGQMPPSIYGVYAYHSDGTLKWKYTDGGAPLRGSPAIGPDGTVYAVVERLGASEAATTEELHAITAAGAQRWKVTISTYYSEIGMLSPVVAPDGTIYAAGRDLTAFKPDGTVKWKQVWGSTYFGSPVIDSTGTVYIVNWASAAPWGQCVSALDPTDGSVKWQSPNLGTYPITGTPVVAKDGTVYLGIHDDLALSGAANAALLAFSSTGTIKWAFPAVDFDIRMQPSIDADGTVYFGTKGNSGIVFAINPDGTEKWRYATTDPVGCPGCGNDVYNTPVIGADGTIYVGNELDMLYAFNPDGTIKWKDGTMPGGAYGESSAALAPDGTLYIGKIYGAFIAVKTESMGLSATAQWPRFHRTNDSAGAQ